MESFGDRVAFVSRAPTLTRQSAMSMPVTVADDSLFTNFRYPTPVAPRDARSSITSRYSLAYDGEEGAGVILPVQPLSEKHQLMEEYAAGAPFPFLRPLSTISSRPAESFVTAPVSHEPSSDIVAPVGSEPQSGVDTQNATQDDSEWKLQLQALRAEVEQLKAQQAREMLYSPPPAYG